MNEHAPGLLEAEGDADEVRILDEQTVIPVGHVTLDRRGSGIHDRGNLRERFFIWSGDDRMDPEVHQGLPSRLPVFVLQRLGEGTAWDLVGEVDHTGRSPEGCGQRAGE